MKRTEWFAMNRLSKAKATLHVQQRDGGGTRKKFTHESILRYYILHTIFSSTWRAQDN